MLFRSIEHDLLIIAVLVENIRRVVARFRTYLDERGTEVSYAKPYFELEDGRLAVRHVPPPKKPIPPLELPPDQRQFVDRGGRFALMRKVVAKTGLREMAQRLTKYQPVPEYDRPDHPAWRLMRAILAEWIGGHDGPVLMVPIPLYQCIEGTANASGYQARFRELAEATGCALHDPLPDLVKHPPDDRRRFRFEKDVHLSPEGHAALAASLAPAIRRVLAGQIVAGR